MFEEGKSYSEISQKFNVSENTLKSWKRRDGWERKSPHKKKSATSNDNKKVSPKGLQSDKNDGDYNVEVSGNDVLVMSKELENYYGEYAGITKLDRFTAELFRKEVNDMVESGFYDQWYENALVQLIFKTNFKLHYVDVINYSWTEVDSVNDLLIAKQIYLKDVSKE